VLVPDAPALSQEHTEQLGGVALEATATAVKGDLDALEARWSAATAVTASAREAALRELRSRAVRAIEEEQPELKPELDRLRRTLAAEGREEAAQRSEFERVVRQAAADFEVLRKRFA
jgi:hypothetical protein